MQFPAASQNASFKTAKIRVKKNKKKYNRLSTAASDELWLGLGGQMW
jgi:hypothetical protein